VNDDDLFAVEHCPECGGELGLGPCGCSLVPKKSQDGPKSGVRQANSMREMVARKLAKKS
jgi:hypothetical protein